MKPGRELDALIDKHVMKLGSESVVVELYPHYSTDIAAAWEVVEKLLCADPSFKVCTHVNSDNEWIWACYFKHGCTVFGDTAAHAICKAALESIGYDTKA